MFSQSLPLRAMHNIAEFEAAARHRLPRGLINYIGRGVEDDLAVRANRSAFKRIRFRPTAKLLPATGSILIDHDDADWIPIE